MEICSTPALRVPKSFTITSFPAISLTVSNIVEQAATVGKVVEILTSYPSGNA